MVVSFEENSQWKKNLEKQGDAGRGKKKKGLGEAKEHELKVYEGF